MDIYKTSDIKIASYLLAAGATYKGVTQESPNRYIFMFDNKNNCEHLKLNYYNGAMIIAEALFQARETLTNEMYDYKRNTNFK